MSESASYFVGGSVIYTQGKSSKQLFIVKRGEVRLIKTVAPNKLQVVQVCTTGDILNDISVLTNKPTDHNAIAKSDVEIVSVDAKDVRNVIDKCPSWIPDIFSTLCERLVDSQEIINEHNLQSSNLDQSLRLSKEEEKILLARIAEFNN